MFATTTSLYTSLPVYRKLVHIDMPAHEGLMMRRLENMRASAFAVSGTRKVACVVSLCLCDKYPFIYIYDISRIVFTLAADYITVSFLGL